VPIRSRSILLVDLGVLRIKFKLVVPPRVHLPPCQGYGEAVHVTVNVSMVDFWWSAGKTSIAMA
jgi:hypothetical protein